jgi:hypothetical protein
MTTNLSVEVLSEARKLISAGVDTELILVFLRDRGFDKIDSNSALRQLFGASTTEAKNLIDLSEAWSDRFYSDTQLRETAREALRHLAAENDPNFKIRIDP